MYDQTPNTLVLISSCSVACRIDHSTGLLNTSHAQFHPSELGPGGHASLQLLAALRLIAMETGVGPGKDEIRISNLTIINVVLRVTGPTHERTLTLYMMGIQVRGDVILNKAHH